jgi:hypothetical protein
VSVRQYDLGGGEKSNIDPPPNRPGGADLHGLGLRHWALLELLAEHGALHTGQVTALLFGSRPAAVRHLRILLRAGLVWRFVHHDDPTHLAYYELSFDGVTALQDRLRDHGLTVPPAIGQPGFDQPIVAQFFTGLAIDARRSGGRRHLYRWRRALDTAVWLRRAGVDRVRPRASGVWIEDGVVVRFLLHVDHDDPRPLSGDPAPPPVAALAGYRHATGPWPATGTPPAACLRWPCWSSAPPTTESGSSTPTSPPGRCPSWSPRRPSPGCRPRLARPTPSGPSPGPPALRALRCA